MTLPFTLSPIQDGIIPIWCGNQFQVGTEFTNVLQYSSNDQGWTDELTYFHEESAGDHHFIDRASRDHAIQQLKIHVKQPNATILEIGCSSGFMLQRIQKEFPQAIILGADVVSEPLKKLASILPAIPLFRFDLIDCPLPDNSINAIVILNVLEHIENDVAAIKQMYRILKPGGIVILEVPAGPHLYDIYDKIMMHYRRYHRASLTQLIQNQGFQITKQSHLGFFLYPGFWFVKKRNKKYLSKSKEVQQEMTKKEIQNTGSSKLMHFIMQTELKISHYINYPTGIRCLITCKK